MYNNQFKNPTFGGFKPDAMKRIANSLGYTGDMSGFQSYLNNNPDKQNQMNQYNQAAINMARGGAVRKYQEGGMGTTTTQQPQPTETTPTPVDGSGMSKMTTPDLTTTQTTPAAAPTTTPAAAPTPTTTTPAMDAWTT